MPRPLLHLVLILKDEEKVITKTLDSCLGVVDGVDVVLDRDTQDKTASVVCDWARHHGVLLRMIYNTFDGFAAQRNKALDHSVANGNAPVFTLTMSADEVLIGGDKLRSFLELRRDDIDGAYCITMQTDVRQWPYSRVLRTDARWRYRGRVHEQPVDPDGQSRVPAMIPGVTVLHAETDPARKLKRLRERDLPLLTKNVNNEELSLEDRARDMFFLAETHLFIAHSEPAGEDGEQVPGGAWFSHYMQAMGLYWQHAMIAEHQAKVIEENEGKGKGALAFDSAMRAYFMFYYVAGKIKIFGPGELEPRLLILSKTAPHLAEVRMLLAENAAQVDARRGLYYALEASRVYEENEKKVGQIRYATQETHVKWSSLALAAECAHALGDEKRAIAFARRAIAAGAPSTRFKIEVEGTEEKSA